MDVLSFLTGLGVHLWAVSVCPLAALRCLVQLKSRWLGLDHVALRSADKPFALAIVKNRRAVAVAHVHVFESDSFTVRVQFAGNVFDTMAVEQDGNRLQGVVNF